MNTLIVMRGICEETPLKLVMRLVLLAAGNILAAISKTLVKASLAKYARIRRAVWATSLATMRIFQLW